MKIKQIIGIAVWTIALLGFLIWGIGIAAMYGYLFDILLILGLSAFALFLVQCLFWAVDIDWNDGYDPFDF